MVLEGALIDLESGQLKWTNIVNNRRDPINAEDMAKEDTLNLLYHDIIYKPVAAQTALTSNP